MRCFVAVEISSSVVENLLPVVKELGKLGLSTTPAEQIHATLCFLGEVPESKIANVVAKLRSISFQRFNCQCVGIGAFPSISKPLVVWVGLQTDKTAELTSLAGKVSTTLGIKEDRLFHPHATLARVKRQTVGLKELISCYSSKDFGSFTVDKFSLKASELKPTGAVYTTIEEFHSAQI